MQSSFLLDVVVRLCVLSSSTQSVSQILAYFTSRKRVFRGFVFTEKAINTPCLNNDCLEPKRPKLRKYFLTTQCHHELLPQFTTLFRAIECHLGVSRANQSAGKSIDCCVPLTSRLFTRPLSRIPLTKSCFTALARLWWPNRASHQPLALEYNPSTAFPGLDHQTWKTPRHNKPRRPLV